VTQVPTAKGEGAKSAPCPMVLLNVATAIGPVRLAGGPAGTVALISVKVGVPISVAAVPEFAVVVEPKNTSPALAPVVPTPSRRFVPAIVTSVPWVHTKASPR
jgi:hypothetical protein